MMLPFARLPSGAMKQLLVWVIVLVAAMPAAGQGILKGIGPVHVVVETLEENEGLGGLRNADLLRDAELRLRTAGIVVETREEYFRGGSGYLYVNVNVYAAKDTGLCAFCIDVEYTEEVGAARGYTDEELVVWARTWGATGEVGTVGCNKLNTIREVVKGVVDQFVNAYLEANPKR